MTERYTGKPPSRPRLARPGLIIPSSFGAPLLMGSSVDLAFAGATAMPPVVKLQNPFRTATLIDEVRFTIKGSPGGSGLGGMIYVKFTLGRIMLSEKFVPLWNYGTLFTTRFETEGSGSNVNYAHYRWLLPKPLFVPEGNQLVPTFLRDATFGSGMGSITVNVAYAGRALQPGTRPPVKIEVPFIGYFEHPSTANYSQSTAQDLKNPFCHPLLVQRLIGRIIEPTSPTSVTDGGILRGNYSTFNVSDPPQLKIIDSAGYSVVDNSSENFTAFNAIFDAQRRAWTYNRALKAKEWMTVQTRYPEGNTHLQRLQISAVGYREETP